MENKYIRYREDTNKYQVRIYNDLIRHSSTHDTLEEALSIRDKLIGPNKETLGREPKVLIIDIETTPILAYVWRTRKENIYPKQIVEDWEILCFAYKWLGDDKVITFDNRQGEEEVVEKLSFLLNEADIVVAHNAHRFDVSRINSKLLQHGFPRPHPFKVVDTLRIVRRNFAITSNSLDYVSRFLSQESKLENEGIGLWIRCMDGDKDAWRKMLEYNKQDVLVLEKVYLRIRGWDHSHPNVGHYYGDNEVRCSSCGSTDLSPTKSVNTNVSEYPALRCQNCGQIVRERKRTNYTEVVGAA